MVDTNFIRAADPNDAGPISQIQAEGWRNAYSSIFPPNVFDEKYGDSDKSLLKWQKILSFNRAGDKYVYETQEAVLGFMSVGKHREFSDKNHAELMALYVDPKTIGRGIGFSLYRQALLWCRVHKVTRLSLWVLKDNKLGIKFYKRQGFEASGREEAYKYGGVNYPEIELTITLTSE